MTSSAIWLAMSVMACPWSCVGGLREPGEREEAVVGGVVAGRRVAARRREGPGDVADLGERAELAGAERLDEHVADGRGLDRPGEHLAAGDVGGQPAEQLD